MDLLKAYDTSDPDSPRTLQPAPEVDISHLVSIKEAQQDTMRDQMYRPAQKNNHLTGHILDYQMNHYVFDEQCNNFKSLGYAQDPGTPQDSFVFNSHLHTTLQG